MDSEISKLFGEKEMNNWAELAINQRSASMNHMVRSRELTLPSFTRSQHSTVAEADAPLLHTQSSVNVGGVSTDSDCQDRPTYKLKQGM